MNHLKIRLAREPDPSAALNVRPFEMRERILTKLFGPIRRILMLIPADQLESITIEEGDPKS